MRIGLPTAETLQGGSLKALLLVSVLFMFQLLRTVGLRAFSMASETYTSGTHSAAFVTCPNDTVARDLARGIVEKKLAACVNIVPAIKSIYEWQGKIEEDNEVLLVNIKTRNCTRTLRAEVINIVPSKVTVRLVEEFGIIDGCKKYIIKSSFFSNTPPYKKNLSRFELLQTALNVGIKNMF
uniref:CutA divalent cation tolerance homolog n=1 Tax=Maylandia zebra TaxID=106582 RepID=A0A3P9DV82_9CICH